MDGLGHFIFIDYKYELSLLICDSASQKQDHGLCTKNGRDSYFVASATII